MIIPATTVDEGMNFMPAGLHLVKVTEVKEWLTKDGNPKKDNNGWPGLEFVLMNQKKELISFQNYYCDRPMNDPIRSSANKCKSEFFITKFKKAIGLDNGSVDSSQIIGKKLYVVVSEVHLVDTNNKAIYNESGKPVVYTELTKDFYPYTEGTPAPIIPGDPLRGEPASGIFYRTKLDTQRDFGQGSSASATQAPPAAKTADDDF